MERKFVLKASNQTNLSSASTLRPGICPLEKTSSWGRRLVIAMSGGVLIFAPLAYGAVHPWAYYSVGLLLTLLSLALTITELYELWSKPSTARVLPYPPLWWLGLGLVLLVLIQTLPWPQGAVQWLSPRAWEIRSMGHGFGMAGYLPLSLNPYSTRLEGLKLWPALVLFFILIYTINRKEQILGLAGLILAVALFEAFYGFWHYRSHLIWGWKNPFTEFGLFGTFINRNHLATFLAMAILLGYGLFLGLKTASRKIPGNLSGWARLRQWSLPEYAEPELRRFLLLFLLLILVVGLIFTGSRGGMLSLLFGFLMMALLSWGRRWKKGHLFIMVFFLSSAVLFSLMLGSSLALTRFVNDDHYERYQAFKGALALFREFPLLGSGLGTFGDLFYRYQPARIKDSYFLHTHSDWLQLLVESGIVGFALVAAGWLIFFTSLAKQWGRRRDTLARGLGLGGIAALGAGAFHALVEFPFHIPAIALLFAGIAAITYLTVYYRFQAVESSSLPGVGFPLNYRKAAIGVILGLIGVQLALGVQICYSWLAETAAPLEINSTRAAPRLEIEDFRRALAFNPKNSKYYLGLAEALEKTGRGNQTPAAVEKSLQAAIWHSPANWGYHLKLADYYLRHYEQAPNRHIPMALRELAAAVTLFPQSAVLHFRIASALEWAEKYYPGTIPGELRGCRAYYLGQAVNLEPNLAPHHKVK
jgi:putative inorganic carbon (HCO3(-)) transporter